MGRGEKRLFLNSLLLLLSLLLLFSMGCLPPGKDFPDNRALEEQETGFEDEATGPFKENEDAERKAAPGEEAAKKVYPQQDAPAPGFRLKSLDGETIRLDDFCKKPLILLFWTKDCPDCLTAMELLEKLYRSGQGVEVFGISDLKEETVRHHIEEHNISFPMLLDWEKEVFDTYLVEDVPTAVAINAQGKIAIIFKGYFDAERVETMRRRMLHQWELDPIIK